MKALTFWDIPVKKLTIQDIARLAGVSTATVSRALHSPQLLREETRDHVMKVIRDNNYIYNVVAGDFSRQRSSILGAFVPWELSGGKINATLIAIQNVLHQHGYPMLINVTLSDAANERRQIIQARERALAGLFFTGFTRENESLIDELTQQEIPCIFLWDTFEGTDRRYVGIDNFSGARDMTRYLIGLGHRRIGYLGAQQSLIARVRKCLDGMQAALREAGLEAREEYILECPSAGLQSGREGMYRMLSLATPPTAILCTSDMLAIAAMSVCRELGLRVPDDMSVAGFDDIDMSAYTVPGLTTVRVPSLEMGGLAARCMLDLVQGNSRAACQYTLKTTLVVRESCGPPPR